jgi:hypothetical protein
MPEPSWKSRLKQLEARDRAAEKIRHSRKEPCSHPEEQLWTDEETGDQICGVCFFVIKPAVPEKELEAYLET